MGEGQQNYKVYNIKILDNKIVGEGQQNYKVEICGEAIRSTARTLPKSIQRVSNWHNGVVRKVLNTLLVERPRAKFREISIRKSKLAGPFDWTTVVDRN